METKKLAAEKAVENIEDGMVVGLGTGSTAYWAIKKIGERVQEGLNIKAVASSKNSEDLAKESGIPIVPFSDIDAIDVTIDGADEVDKNFYLIKGGGGALLREKILASNSKKFIVIVDETKMVDTLGKFPLPVEIVPFASSLTIKKLQQLNCKVQIRQKDNKDFITDNGNLIADCFFGEIPDPEVLNTQLHSIPGVVENGLFKKEMVHHVIVGHNDGRVEVK
ncbi:MAG: ribose-5-phosphate isomerase RpiA [Bacteroidota bacterium]|nr:ribose-5-phosphate isomerase RpiA [Bacteroidota bacterium]